MLTFIYQSSGYDYKIHSESKPSPKNICAKHAHLPNMIYNSQHKQKVCIAEVFVFPTKVIYSKVNYSSRLERTH